MAKQISLFLTPSDTEVLESAIRARASLQAVDGRSSGPAATLMKHLVVEDMGNTWLRVCLVRPDDIADLRFAEVASQGYWAVDVLRSPVIEFWRCYFDGRILRSGRLFFETGYFEGDAWVDKPAFFLLWADDVFRTAKKALKREASLDSYLGEEAWSLRTAGQVTFSP
jgi:hypothetical protein